MWTLNVVRGLRRVDGRVGAGLGLVMVLVCAGSCAEVTNQCTQTKAGGGATNTSGRSSGLDISDVAEEPGAAAEHFGATRACWYERGAMAGSSGSRAWCGVVTDEIASEYPVE